MLDERRERIEQHLDEEFDIIESHQFGSHTRGTMVGPVDEDSDTDVMFVLDENAHGEYVDSENGAENCLRKMKRVLEKRYPNSRVKIDRNVVAVKFSDFTVEAAPAFKTKSDDYVIPDTYSDGKSWIRTNPRQYKNQFEAVDQARGGRLSKVARVAKKYRDNHDLPLSSYHIEVIAYDHVRRNKNKTASTEELVEGFFRELPSQISNGTSDPATGSRIDDNLSREERREAIKEARKARECVDRAREYRRNGEHEEANEEYREAVGEDI
jgi:predicted nucleotidyltransferase